MNNLKYFNKKYAFIFIITILIFLYFKLILNQANLELQAKKSKINIIDLKKPILLNEQIKCRLSIKINDIETTLCIHDLDKDVWLSQQIHYNGIWERNVVEKWISYVQMYKDCFVLDIGANIGQYTMFAAKIGRDVVSVEPFDENIFRIQKAAQLENLQNKITMIKNVITDKPNELRMLSRNPDHLDNIASFKIKLNDNDISRNKTSFSKYEQKFLAETIIFDDLIDYIPSKYKCSVIKIDIEGLEPYAFRYSSKFFKKYDVKFIAMEWGMFTNYVNVNDALVENMINMFTKYKLKPYSLDESNLDIKLWKKWPFDVIWKL